MQLDDDGDMSENESEDEFSENSDGSEGLDSSEDDSEDDFDDIDLSHFTKKPSEEAGHADNTVLVNEASEEVQKGICVQNQLKIWEKLLEVRIKAQKMLITANSLPDYDAHIALTEDDTESQFLEKCESTCDNVYGLIDNLLELQSTLVER